MYKLLLVKYRRVYTILQLLPYLYLNLWDNSSVYFTAVALTVERYLCPLKQNVFRTGKICQYI